MDIKRFVRGPTGVMCGVCDTAACRTNEAPASPSSAMSSPNEGLEFASPSHPLTSSLSFLSSPTMSSYTAATPTKENKAKEIASRQLQQHCRELEARVKQLEAVNKHMVKSVDDVASQSLAMENKVRDYAQQNKDLIFRSKELEDGISAQTEKAKQTVEKSARRCAELVEANEALMQEKDQLKQALKGLEEQSASTEAQEKEVSELREANTKLTEQVKHLGSAVVEMNEAKQIK